MQARAQRKSAPFRRIRAWHWRCRDSRRGTGGAATQVEFAPGRKLLQASALVRVGGRLRMLVARGMT
eukprot:15482632-Alexandrium_andersonii.AAC.1